MSNEIHDDGRTWLIPGESVTVLPHHHPERLKDMVLNELGTGGDALIRVFAPSLGRRLKTNCSFGIQTLDGIRDSHDDNLGGVAFPDDLDSPPADRIITLTGPAISRKLRGMIVTVTFQVGLGSLHCIQSLILRPIAA